MTRTRGCGPISYLEAVRSALNNLGHSFPQIRTLRANLGQHPLSLQQFAFWRSEDFSPSWPGLSRPFTPRTCCFVLKVWYDVAAWMAGTSPAMTTRGSGDRENFPRPLRISVFGQPCTRGSGKWASNTPAPSARYKQCRCSSYTYAPAGNRSSRSASPGRSRRACASSIPCRRGWGNPRAHGRRGFRAG